MGDGGDMIKLGPAGSVMANQWDEKGRSRIAQIFISHGDGVINSIQFQYLENRMLKLSERHGGSSSGNKFDVVKLNQLTEYITWIRGHKNSSSGRLCSVTFGTNHGEYGPFGTFKPADTQFCFNLGPENDRQFGGFHGTADYSAVTSIGVYLNPNANGKILDASLELFSQLRKTKSTKLQK